MHIKPDKSLERKTKVLYNAHSCVVVSSLPRQISSSRSVYFKNLFDLFKNSFSSRKRFLGDEEGQDLQHSFEINIL